MAVFSELNYSVCKDRLDAEYYRPEFIENEKTLRTLSKSPDIQLSILRKVTKKIKKGIFYILAEEYKEEGVPFLRVTNLKNLFIYKADLAYISEEKNIEEKKTSLRSGDIVISKSGTLGLVSIIPQDIQKCNISQDIIGIWSDHSKVMPEYTAIFLLSKFGQLQLLRGRSQLVQPHLALHHVKSLLIPILNRKFQEHIKQIVERAYNIDRDAEHKFIEANKLLFKQFAFEESELSEKKFYDVLFSEIERYRRFDPEHYKPKYKDVMRLLESSGYEIKKLEQVIEISRETFDPSIEPDKKFSYVELANVNPLTGEVLGVGKIVGHNAPSRARMVLKSRDVLVSSLGGSLDNIGLIHTDLDGAIGSTGFFIIRSNMFLCEYLFLLFKSPLLKSQLEQKTSGTIMPAVTLKNFKNLLIPLVKKEDQHKIASKIKEYFEMKKMSRNLIQNAKKEVENFISETIIFATKLGAIKDVQ